MPVLSTSAGSACTYTEVVPGQPNGTETLSTVSCLSLLRDEILDSVKKKKKVVPLLQLQLPYCNVL